MDTPGGSYTPPPPPPDTAPTAPSGSDRTIFLILSYLGLLALIPLLVKKEDPDLQWHAKNGLTLFGAEICWVILQIILGFIPVLGCGVHILGCVVWIGFVVLVVICIIKAVQGQRFRIPLVTDISEKW
jgi:uncharacterized membrane protein